MKIKNNKLKVIFILSLIAIAIFFHNAPLQHIYKLPNNIVVSYSAIEDIQKKTSFFGNWVTANIKGDLSVSNNGADNYNLQLKLFNLIPIKNIQLDVTKHKIYASGDPVGFSLNAAGVIVIGTSKVLTEKGYEESVKDEEIKPNDIIVKIGDTKINNVSDVSKAINKEDYVGEELNVVLIRNGVELTTKVTPKFDVQSKKYKIGFWLKDDASGIGTLTYVNLANNRYGALGHAICDADTKEPFEAKHGEMYKCTIIGLTKGAKGVPGEIKGLFVQGRNPIGLVDKNTSYGVFGEINQNSIKYSEDRLFDVGGRLTAKAGKAQILSNVDGNGVKAYDIEIIKTNYQHISNEKSMVIKVVDKELLAKTGGIIQGMSGSPIIQNNKIIGAVTHVFVSDPSKGFGIYLDWMIDN